MDIVLLVFSGLFAEVVPTFSFNCLKLKGRGEANAAADEKPIKRNDVSSRIAVSNCVAFFFLNSLHLCSAERGSIPWPSVYHREQCVLSLLCASQGHQGNIDLTFEIVKRVKLTTRKHFYI